MKRIFLIFVALTIATLIIFNVAIDARLYINRLSNIPNYLDLLQEIKDIWTTISTNIDGSIKELVQNFNIFELLVSYFQNAIAILVGIFKTIVVIPTKLLFNVVLTLWYLLPIDVYKTIDYSLVVWNQ